MNTTLMPPAPPPVSALVAAPPKPQSPGKPKLEIPPGRTLYGGRHATIGTAVWYIHEKVPGKLVALPARLHDRAAVDGDRWNVRVYFHVTDRGSKIISCEFNETPTHGCWCWPIEPEGGTNIPDVSGIQKTVADLLKKVEGQESHLKKIHEQVVDLLTRPSKPAKDAA